MANMEPAEPAEPVKRGFPYMNLLPKLGRSVKGHTNLFSGMLQQIFRRKMPLTFGMSMGVCKNNLPNMESTTLLLGTFTPQHRHFEPLLVPHS